MDVPPIDPAKMLGHLRDWEKGDQLPGRTMAYLKTAGFAVWLADRAAAGDERAAALAAVWAPWEKAKAGPLEVLEALAAGGADELLAAASV